MSAADASFDVLVVGGGPVGAAVAALLAAGAPHVSQRPLGIAVLERDRPPLPAVDAPLDLRVSAFSRASERILDAAGAHDAVFSRRASPYERMHVWHESVPARGPDALIFDAAEAGEPDLGHIVENRLAQAGLLDAFEAQGGTVVPGQLEGLDFSGSRVRARTSAGTFEARLVVGADGARSAVRDAASLPVESGDYGQLGIVTTVATERPHERTAWQCFLGNGTVALLPLGDGTSSIVWSLPNPRAEELLAASPEAFAAALDRATDEVLGHTRVVAPRAAFPLRRLVAGRYVLERCALVGDAAHVVHPLAGQGVNLGLLDAAALADVVLAGWREGEDPGALRLLRRYERWRRSENAVMASAMDVFDRFLARGDDRVSRFAQRGLGFVNRSGELKRLFVRRALGLTGDLPTAARTGRAA
jgi:2-octaprenylphenol hydroxylase